MSGQWFKVDVTLWSHQKVLSLPSDAARWAWIVCLSHAKPRGGTFTSEAELRELLGARYEHVAAFRDVALLDGLAVHEWDTHQADSSAERMRRLREKEREIERERGSASHVRHSVTSQEELESRTEGNGYRQARDILASHPVLSGLVGSGNKQQGD